MVARRSMIMDWTPIARKTYERNVGKIWVCWIVVPWICLASNALSNAGGGVEKCSGRVRLNTTAGLLTDGPGDYTGGQACSWIIGSGQPNSTIWLRVEHIAVECLWDSIYIFDGESVTSPMLAALSGIVTPISSDVTGSLHRERVTTPSAEGDVSGMLLRATSGYAYIYFYADVAYQASGFNISFRISPCADGSACSAHGDCTSNGCICDVGWTGEDCSVMLCSLTLCTENGGMCQNDTGYCACPQGRVGMYCDRLANDVAWTKVNSSSASSLNWKEQARASHSMVAFGHKLFVFGGFSLNHARYMRVEPFIVFNTANREWSVVAQRSSPSPTMRFQHTAVLYESAMFVFGGRVGALEEPSSELWTVSLASDVLHWSRLADAPLPLMGHSATVVGARMIVLFGLSIGKVGFNFRVYEYDFVRQSWSVVPSVGALANGRTGHSTVYHKPSDRLYIFGGISDAQVTADMLVYNPTSRQWSVFSPAVAYRPAAYLHSAVLAPSSSSGNFIVLFGGCNHNDTVKEKGAKCHSEEFWIYNIQCNLWSRQNATELTAADARFGHSAVVQNGSMWVFGGFDGTVRNDMLRYTFAKKCDEQTSKACLFGATCKKDVCSAASTCTACHQLGCQWCDDIRLCYSLSLRKLCSNTSLVKPNGKCRTRPDNARARCSEFGPSRDCRACQQMGCTYIPTSNYCLPASQLLNMTTNCSEQQCELHGDCKSCTASASCLWCPSTRRCTGPGQFMAQYPYGQCFRWFNIQERPGKVCSNDLCSALRTCKSCQDSPGCGWCDDGSGTGTGHCRLGTLRGPQNATADPFGLGQPMRKFTVEPLHCPKGSWFYTGQCPACQCNGHSRCINGSVCENCTGNTQGLQCEQCALNFFGNPTNNGTCSPCDCNGEPCREMTGACVCDRFGVTGKQCSECARGYEGNATSRGLCFGILSTGTTVRYKITDKTENVQLVVRPRLKKTLQFTLNLLPSNETMDARLTIEYSDVQGTEFELFWDKKVSSASYKFKRSEFNFDSKDAIRLYMANFSSLCTIEVSYVYQNDLNLLVIFATFFGCFLALLLLASVFWYIKHQIQWFLDRRQHRQALVQMANRPFVRVNLLMSSVRSVPALRNKAVPIAIQPLAHPGKVALVTFAMRLPGNENNFPAHGQPGLAFASTVLSTASHKHKAFQSQAAKHSWWKSASLQRRRQRYREENYEL